MERECAMVHMPEHTVAAVESLLPEGCELVFCESEPSGSMSFTVRNAEGDETLLRFSTLDVMDRPKACNGTVVVDSEQDCEFFRNQIIQLVEEHNSKHPVELDFSQTVEELRDGRNQEYIDPEEEPGFVRTMGSGHNADCSGEVMQVTIRTTTLDVRPSVTAIITEGIDDIVLNPSCGCCELKAKITLLTTMVNVGDTPLDIGSKLPKPVIKAILENFDRNGVIEHITIEDLEEAVLVGFGEDQISSYAIIDIPAFSEMKMRLCNSGPLEEEPVQPKGEDEEDIEEAEFEEM